MACSLRSLIILLFLTVPSAATGILFSENFESGAIPGQFYGGTLLSTAGVPANIGDGNWALYNNAPLTSQGNAGMPIGLQLTGLQPNQPAALSMTFIAIDSWDGYDLGTFSPDFFGIQINPELLFTASFRNWMGTHYTGDGTPGYGDSPPPNSTITKLSSDSNYLVNTATDSFYKITLDGFHADAGGNLNIYFYAFGSGWQGGYDESFAIDNLVVTTPWDNSVTDTPEPATWLTLTAGLVFLRSRRKRRAV